MPNDTDAPGPPLTLAITGATGLIGTALVKRLRARGHTVRRVVRSAKRPESNDVVWNAEQGQLDPRSLEGVQALVHLAGEPVAQRWTPETKRAIRESRVRSTELLARTISGMTTPPAVFLSGSAIGYYGNRGDELLPESSAPGTGFLAQVTQEWEQATAAAEQAGIRVAHLRTGIVLDAHGGALERLLVPFKLGVGGPIGGGHQWMSWISLEDELRAIEHALRTESLRGPVNLVAPNPVTNAEFASILGRVLSRPAILPVPSFALELLFGEMAEATILAGQRVVPGALAASGFQWLHATLDAALRAALASPSHGR